MDPRIRKSRLWTKDFILTSLANLFLFFSFHMLTPTLPVFVVERGGDKFEAGMVVGLFTVTALLIRPFAGRALDVMDRKKVLLFGLLVFTVSVISYQWMLVVSMILFIRTIQGIGWGIATTTYATMVSDLIVAERRAEGMGYYGLSINMGMAFAPLLGIWVMDKYSFTVVFMIAATSVIISFLLSRQINFPKQTGKVNLEKAVLIEKSSILPALLIMLMTLSHGGIISTLTLFGQETGIKNVGWFFLATAIFMMLTRPIAGRIADQKGRVFILLPGSVALAAGLLLLSNSSNSITLIIAAMFYGVGFGSIQPTLQAWTISRAMPHRRGVATATYFSAFDLGIGLGALLMGFLAKWLDYATIYKISIVFMVVYGIIYGFYLIQEKNKGMATKKLKQNDEVI